MLLQTEQTQVNTSEELTERMERTVQICNDKVQAVTPLCTVSTLRLFRSYSISTYTFLEE